MNASEMVKNSESCEMAVDSTPVSKSPKSPSTVWLADELPATPQLPFNPPQRRSSLAFSKIIESPVAVEKDATKTSDISAVKHQTRNLQSNIGRKRTVETPFSHSSISQGHVASVQKKFQAARTNLHLDMHFAASPAGSIDSRLPSSRQDQNKRLEGDLQASKTDKSWRYSNIPKLFSAAVSDVREPLPDGSPTLPKAVQRLSDDDATEIEPTNNGFASPLSARRGVDGDSELGFPPPLTSSPLESDMTSQEILASTPSSRGMEGILELEQPMTGLKVTSDLGIAKGQGSRELDESPIVDHLRRRSCIDRGSTISIPNPPDSIFLSQSARAAAESARAKRGLLSQSSEDGDVRERLTFTNQCPDPSAHDQDKSNCSDPGVHHNAAPRAYPEPLAHGPMTTPEVLINDIDEMRAQPRAWGNDYFTSGSKSMATNAPIMVGHRTTAAGSPMPFARRAKNPTRNIERYPLRGSILNLPPPLSRHHLLTSEPVQRKANHSQRPSEHFRPGWHYASRAAEIFSRPGPNLYSFSTAAAKVTGESAAPDSRIRDSYRTDTLTPLARPPGRFRRTGIAATLPSSRSRRFYRGPPRRASHGRLPPDLIRRFGMPYLSSIESKSSPTRPSNRYLSAPNPGKQDHHDSGASDFDVAEDERTMPIQPSMRLRPSEEALRMDEHTRAAVRMSLFGRSTPECLHGAREGIRELSPNVNIWRKGMVGGPLYRRKRRPSYWDSDLEEIMMSPAGRGGIASSPPVSKRSMVAELDSTSSQADVVNMDENAKPDRKELISHAMKTETPEVTMTDITELEA